MALPRNIPRDGKIHTYCLKCLQETLQTLTIKGEQHYRCSACSSIGPRALIIDPAINWWVDDSREYWHEASGIFMRNSHGEFLFFDRVKYPFGLTVPAGHVDRNEKPNRTARRELREEAGVDLPLRAFQHVTTINMRGDKCRRGADTHRWHSYVCALPPSARIKVDQQEGLRPIWLTLEKAMQRRLTFATRTAIQHHGRKIQAAIR